MKRWSEKIKAETKGGSWVTRQRLKEVEKWTKNHESTLKKLRVICVRFQFFLIFQIFGTF